MRGWIWPTVFCVCLLVALSRIHLAQDKWPCKNDPNLLRDKDGNPILFPAKELGPQIIWYERPKYPNACRCSGSVQVLVLINTEGRVECFQFLNGHPLIKASISEALKKWRFQPVTVEARQVSITSIITFNFNDSIFITDNITRPVEAPCKTRWKFRPMMKNRRRVSFLGRLLFTLKSD